MLINGHLADVQLSPRERDVLAVMAQMYSTEEAAALLHISANTVKSHLKTIYWKLGVHGRGEAVRRAQALGLLDDLGETLDTA